MSTRKSDELVNRLVRDRILTAEGKEWLVCALDPFHDTQIKCCGYPDTNVSASVVQVVRQTAAVTAPTGVTGTWDCNIFSLPIMDATPFDTATQSVSITGEPQNELSAFHFTPGTLGPLNVASAASGTALPPLSATSLFDNSAYAGGAGRVIGTGFEITNTTAEIYKQGQAIAYRIPQPNDTSQTYILANSSVVTSPNISGAASLRTLNAPPQSAADAMLLAGSLQWAAAEGAYCVDTLTSPALPVVANNATGFIMPDQPTAGTVLVPHQLTTSLGNFALDSPQKMNEFNTTGVYLQGLSNQTSLQVTQITYIERFPAVSNVLEADLVVLAKPSPDYDLFAQELYSECLSNMPVAVMVKENSLGDWFKGAIQKVTSVVAPVLGLIPHPVAQGLSVAATGINRALNGKPQREVTIYDAPSGMVHDNGQQSQSMQSLSKSSKRRLKKRLQKLESGIQSGRARQRNNMTRNLGGQNAKSFARALSNGQAWTIREG